MAYLVTVLFFKVHNILSPKGPVWFVSGLRLWFGFSISFRKMYEIKKIHNWYNYIGFILRDKKKQMVDKSIRHIIWLTDRNNF